MTILFPFQTKSVRQIEQFGGRALLAHEMGLGKSAISLVWAKQFLDKWPAVVICPASVKYHWEREAIKHVGMRAEILEGRNARPLTGGFNTVGKLYIINYDILQQWGRYLMELNPGLIIVDECHYIKNRAAKRTKQVRYICSFAPYLLFLSGTPLTNRPAELWPSLNMICPKHFPSFFYYAQRYCRPHRTPWGWDYSGATRLGELHKELKTTCMIRYRKVDVLKQLPPKTRHVIPVDIENRKEYDRAVKEFIKWLHDQSPMKAERAAKAEQIVKQGYLLRLAAKLKMKSIFNWLDNYLEESDGKIIVFGLHKQIIRPLYEKYRKLAVFVDGSVTGQNRQFCIDQFTNDPKTRMFIGQMIAAGTGWPGTAASTVLMTEMYWVPAIHTQAEDRPHRIGQENPVNIVYQIARNTIEEDLCQINQAKQETVGAVLDGTKAEVMDVWDQLLKMTIARNRKTLKPKRRKLAHI